MGLVFRGQQLQGDCTCVAASSMFDQRVSSNAGTNHTKQLAAYGRKGCLRLRS
jgi:hypothetical protein